MGFVRVIIMGYLVAYESGPVGIILDEGVLNTSFCVEADTLDYDGWSWRPLF